MITISRERYNQLLEAEAFLDCLEACGVDNWDGYCDAKVMMDECENEE